eukprot:29306-Rhodomonas_salina.1
MSGTVAGRTVQSAFVLRAGMVVPGAVDELVLRVAVQSLRETVFGTDLVMLLRVGDAKAERASVPAGGTTGCQVLRVLSAYAYPAIVRTMLHTRLRVS